MENLMQIDKC